MSLSWTAITVCTCCNTDWYSHMYWVKVSGKLTMRSAFKTPGKTQACTSCQATDLQGLEASKIKCIENLLGLSDNGTSFKVFFFKFTALRIVAVCVSSCGGFCGCAGCCMFAGGCLTSTLCQTNFLPLRAEVAAESSV